MLVTLHIYDVAQDIKLLNRLLSVWGTGAFHAGVEVYDKEWSFGSCGLFCNNPMAAKGHAYKESVPIGHTTMSEQQVLALLRRLNKLWNGSEYNLLKRNCCHFSDALCKELTGQAVPARIQTLAATGAAIADSGAFLANQAMRKKSFAERVIANLVGGVCGSGQSGCGQGVAKAARRLTWDRSQPRTVVAR